MDKKAYFEALMKESTPTRQPGFYYNKKKKLTFKMPTSFEEKGPTFLEKLPEKRAKIIKGSFDKLR
jgi:hypothetical protein